MWVTVCDFTTDLRTCDMYEGTVSWDTRFDARKRSRATAALKTIEGRKTFKRAKTKDRKMADFDDMICISYFIEFKLNKRAKGEKRSKNQGEY